MEDMDLFLSVIYFIGIVMLGISISTYTGITEGVFMIIGSGTIVYSFIAAIIYYGKRK